jgi:hypothetical protein
MLWQNNNPSINLNTIILYISTSATFITGLSVLMVHHSLYYEEIPRRTSEDVLIFFFHKNMSAQEGCIFALDVPINLIDLAERDSMWSQSGMRGIGVEPYN